MMKYSYFHALSLACLCSTLAYAEFEAWRFIKNDTTKNVWVDLQYTLKKGNELKTRTVTKSITSGEKVKFVLPYSDKKNTTFKGVSQIIIYEAVPVEQHATKEFKSGFKGRVYVIENPTFRHNNAVLTQDDSGNYIITPGKK